MPRKFAATTAAQTTHIPEAEATHDSVLPTKENNKQCLAQGGEAADDTSIPADATPPTPPRPNRPQQLLALLGGSAPVALTQICEAFAWQPHTARAAISGLRKAGHQIDVGRIDGGETAYSLLPSEGRPYPEDAARTNASEAAPSTGRSRRKAKSVEATDTAGPVGQPKADAAASGTAKSSAEIMAPTAPAPTATPA